MRTTHSMRLPIVLLFSALAFAPHVRARQVTLHGVRIAESEAQVRRSLLKFADFQREEEGQQVWKLRHDLSADYLLIGFDASRRVRYVTVVAKQGQALRCEVLGDMATAQSAGQLGNMQFTRQLGDPGEKIFAIARGDSPDHIHLCSIKRVGAKSAEDVEEEREKAEREQTRKR